MYKGQRITVIIPCLNEEQGIRRVLEAMPDFVDEIIVVDNNSTDRTHEVAVRWAPKSFARRCAATAAATSADSPAPQAT